MFAGWHNVKIHEIEVSRRESFSVGVPNRSGSLENSPHFIFPTPPVFDYYSQLARGSVRSREVIISIAVS